MCWLAQAPPPPTLAAEYGRPCGHRRAPLPPMQPPFLPQSHCQALPGCCGPLLTAIIHVVCGVNAPLLPAFKYLYTTLGLAPCMYVRTVPARHENGPESPAPYFMGPESGCSGVGRLIAGGEACISSAKPIWHLGLGGWLGGGSRGLIHRHRLLRLHPASFPLSLPA